MGETPSVGGGTELGNTADPGAFFTWLPSTPPTPCTNIDAAWKSESPPTHAHTHRRRQAQALPHSPHPS